MSSPPPAPGQTQAPIVTPVWASGQLQLLQALPAAIYITDPEGRITFSNEAAANRWGFRPTLE
ncbi:MAG: PAS domain-containing protein, partial [Arenicellales bacterium]